MRDEDLERRIRWTQITELPDPSPWLRGGELVLTNGLWRRRRSDSRKFVEKLVASEITVLALGLSRVDEPFPPELIEACEAHSLPLVAVYPPVSFTEITRAVAEHYSEQRSKDLLRTISRSETLVATLVGGSGARGVLRVLERDHDLSCVLFDRAGRPLAQGRRSASPAESSAVRSVIAGDDELPTRLIADGDPVGHVYPVRALGEADAVLLCRHEDDQLPEATRAAIEQALGFLGLELARSQTVRAIERRFAGELIQLIAAGEPRRADAEERLRAFGIDPTHAAAVIVASRGEAADGESLALALERLLVQRGVPVVVPARHHEAIAIAEWAGPEADLRATAVDLWRSLRAADRAAPLGVGVGSLSAGGGSLRRSLAEARHACRMALRGRGVDEAAVLTHADIASYSLLFALQDADVAQAFRSRVLGSVISYDEQRGTDLVHTLSVFLASSGHWKVAAEQLHVHVNTLRNRLARVERLTGRQLGDMSDRVDLFLALRAEDD